MIAKLLIGVVKFYRYFISPLTRPSCRFYPTCSSYAIEAVETYGAFKGGYLAVRRLLKCHPLHSGGIDLVPKKELQIMGDFRRVGPEIAAPDSENTENANSESANSESASLKKPNHNEKPYNKATTDESNPRL